VESVNMNIDLRIRKINFRIRDSALWLGTV
jgi:hypothetical protein